MVLRDGPDRLKISVATVDEDLVEPSTDADPEALPASKQRCPRCSGICLIGSSRCRHCNARLRKELDPNRGVDLDLTELYLFGATDAWLLSYLRDRGIPVYFLGFVFLVLMVTAGFWWIGSQG
jgi:hypothetical protein